MKVVKSLIALASLAFAGMLVWRKVEESRLEEDLWAEAERTPLS